MSLVAPRITKLRTEHQLILRPSDFGLMNTANIVDATITLNVPVRKSGQSTETVNGVAITVAVEDIL